MNLERIFEKTLNEEDYRSYDELRERFMRIRKFVKEIEEHIFNENYSEAITQLRFLDHCAEWGAANS